MADHNKSLGRFQLRGIPPAPRGVPQIQVAFDIDANGILQVTAVDKYTGREQSITVQGAANLTETDVNKMLQDAEQFADSDRRRRERIDKRNRAQDLISQCDRQLRETALDFGPQFASGLRREIEGLMRDLQTSVAQDDDRQIDLDYANLQDALYELKRDANQAAREFDEEEDFFDLPSMDSIKTAVTRSVSKGVEAVTGQSPTSTTVRRPPSRITKDTWDDWDDDDW